MIIENLVMMGIVQIEKTCIANCSYCYLLNSACFIYYMR